MFVQCITAGLIALLCCCYFISRAHGQAPNPEYEPCPRIRQGRCHRSEILLDHSLKLRKTLLCEHETAV